ncbi:MAG: S-layer homology domain-containing protein [Clostridiales bacterium]|nr:S-layer homology domain-containing protein [Clostridiales bacterium]
MKRMFKSRITSRVSKKLSFAVSLILTLALLPVSVFANSGDIGYFGGITEGRRLPKTTELLLASENDDEEEVEFIYKEVIFLSGEPVEFEGLLSVESSGQVTEAENVGTYEVTYRVTASDTTGEDALIDRNIIFNVNWRREGKQIIKDMESSTWRETVRAGDVTFTLDERQSYFNVSIIEDHTAAVTYYRGDTSQRAVYTGGDTPTTHETYGSFYGYGCAWSNTETHRMDGTVYNDEWQMQYQIRPSVSVSKTLQYTENEPTAISFDGNYKEVMANESGLFYDIFVSPPQFFDTPKTGSANIPSANVFEQLIAPDLNFLKGHYAESDIKKLFAMQVLGGEPKFYIPNQAITRSQYTTAIVKALKLPLVEMPTENRRNPAVVMLFPDVSQDDPNFQFIMTAYKAGIAVGRSNGKFFADSPIQREEALVILLRCLGLENLGLDPTPTTLFTDDGEISSWARRELYAAERIGIISQDEDGHIHPKQQVTKAEAAALIGSLINYMRSELKLDYAEHIVDYVY